jgi:hypothetical protein
VTPGGVRHAANSTRALIPNRRIVEGGSPDAWKTEFVPCADSTSIAAARTAQSVFRLRFAADAIGRLQDLGNGFDSARRRFESFRPSHAVPLFRQCPVSRKKPRSSGALRRVLSPGDRKGSISGQFGAPVGPQSLVAILECPHF